MKRKIMILALCVLLLALSVGGSLAYFSEKSEIVHNVITTGGIEIELIETDGDGKPFEEIKNAMPGCTYGHEVTVKNIGSNDAFVRVKMEESIVKADGTQGDTGLIAHDFNTEKWELKGDYYYYKSILKSGETSEPLFNEFSIDPKMGDDYQQCTINVDVYAQAVQAANNSDSALIAKGWPA